MGEGRLGRLRAILVSGPASVWARAKFLHGGSGRLTVGGKQVHYLAKGSNLR